MRNEIFNQIKQNKKRYYSELKISEKKISKPKVTKSDLPNNEGNQSNNNDILFPDKKTKINIPKIHLNVEPIKNAGRSASKITLTYIMKGNSWFNNLNQLLIDHTGTVTQRFYDITCKFFEDPGDTEDYSEELSFRNSQPDLHERSGTLNFTGINQSGILTLDATYMTSHERILLWLNKQYQKVVLFFESDELTEIKEINSPKIEPKEIYHNQQEPNLNTSIAEISHNSVDTVEKEGINTTSSKLFALIFNNPFMTSVNIISTAETVMIFGKKTLLTIFPIINRFI